MVSKLVVAILFCLIPSLLFSGEPAEYENVPPQLWNADDIASWFEFWRKHIPEAHQDSFCLLSRVTLSAEGLHRFSFSDYYLPWESRQSIICYSPDSSRAADYLAFALEDIRGIRVFTPGPDSYVYMLDLKGRVGERWASCGTACWYQIGAWIDSTRFAIAGTIDTGERHENWHLAVDLFDVESRERIRFIGPEAPSQQVHRTSIHSQWTDWRENRFPLIQWREKEEAEP